MEKKIVTIYIDDKPYEVEEGQDLLKACLSLGFNVPYFCWHPAMHSVGACRQCAVKVFRDENDKKGKIVMSCMTAATDGTRLSIDDPEARQFRASVIEWLMLNHPHDCPVCDEGGECHLQDMTVMTGHIYRRTRFKKRTHRNQYLGPFINHEMNRCIQCYRCVRFYNDYAGGRDFSVFSAHDSVYFGRYEEGILRSEFSGNLIEVCPTGVFTDRTLKSHYTRKWDLQTAPSICVHCGLGCNTIPGERYGTLRRIRNRYNGEVNGYFLCDRGRFGYGFVNSDTRIRKPLLNVHKSTTGGPASKDEALDHIARILHFGARVIGIGSPRASMEANFALRSLVGPGNFYDGLSEKEHETISEIAGIMQKSPASSPSLKDVSMADSVFILGEDISNTAPMMALALRQAVRRKPMERVRQLRIPEWNDAAVREAIQDEKGPLFIGSLWDTGIDDIATEIYRAAPDDLARLGCAVAHEIKKDLPAVDDLPRGTASLAKRIARALKTAERPLIVSGAGCGSREIIKAAADIAWALCEGGRKAGLCYVVPECNSLGLGLMGGEGLDKAVRRIVDGDADSVVVLENDLYRRMEADKLDSFFGAASHVIAIDHYLNRTTFRADVVLPAGTFAESDGLFVNNEGRAQGFYQVFVAEGEIQESWRWIRDMMLRTRREAAAAWKGLDDIRAAMTAAMPVLGPAAEIAPGAGFRIAGQKIPRQPHRYSGRTAIHAGISVHEPQPPEDPDSPLSYSMEGYAGRPPSPLITHFWAPGWNSVQSVNKFQSEVGGPLAGGDPGQRLIEPEAKEEAPYFRRIPPPFEKREGRLLVLPRHHIFGSGELSARSPGISGLVPVPYIGLNEESLDGLGLREGDEVEIRIGAQTLFLRAGRIPSLPPGTAALPVGLPGLEGIPLPSWGRLKKAGGKTDADD
jgi:NADH-quinone oxidoreductase subunit G